MDASELVSRATYVHALRPELPAPVFERARSRLAFVPAQLAVIVIATLAIAGGWVPWFVVPLLSLVIGAGFAGLTFVAHEALHGAIVSKRWQYAVGWLGFLPFLVSPRLWIAWHNKAHHGHANFPDDPDGYPTLDAYRASRSTRFSVDAFSLGGKRWRGGLSLILGFTVQSADQLLSARKRGFLTRGEQRKALGESGLMLLLWATVAVLVGPLAFVFVYVLPVLVANVCVMAFILTNHSLSPRVAINDPLASGLSVTTPRLVEWLTLGFGYHVEHHLFPAVSMRHGRAIRAGIREHWPERYQSMALGAALQQLHRTARVYRTPTTLHDPLTGAEHPTLAPRARA